MRTQKFTAYIKKLQYNKFENENPTKFQDPVVYSCQVTLLEIKVGMNHAKKVYLNNVLLYITEDEYNTQALGVGDKIEISDKAQWVANPISLNIYDKKKLEGMNPSRLQKDEKGNTYAKVTFDAYTLKVKQGDWKIVEKADEICYIQCGKVKFYINKTQMNDDAYCFFFNKDVYDKIEENNFKEMELNCYLHKQKRWRKLVEVQCAYDDDSSKYFVNLIIKGENDA